MFFIDRGFTTGLLSAGRKALATTELPYPPCLSQSHWNGPAGAEVLQVLYRARAVNRLIVGS